MSRYSIETLKIISTRYFWLHQAYIKVLLDKVKTKIFVNIFKLRTANSILKLTKNDTVFDM